jgi:hypothetical protein
MGVSGRQFTVRFILSLSSLVQDCVGGRNPRFLSLAETNELSKVFANGSMIEIWKTGVRGGSSDDFHERVNQQIGSPTAPGCDYKEAGFDECHRSFTAQGGRVPDSPAKV